jgi:hypothetical protein
MTIIDISVWIITLSKTMSLMVYVVTFVVAPIS